MYKIHMKADPINMKSILLFVHGNILERSCMHMHCPDSIT